MQKLLETIKKIPKGFFSHTDILKISALEKGSLNVALSRLKKKGVIYALTRGYYALDPAKVDYEKFALEIYPPSYLSFELVLGKNGVLSQKPYNLTLATLQRAKTINAGDRVLIYHHLNPALFWGYFNNGGISEADTEKAFLDLAYLSLNGYAKFDASEMNLQLLDRSKLKKYLAKFGIEKLTRLAERVFQKAM